MLFYRDLYIHVLALMWVYLPYTQAARWLWQQHIILLRVMGWFQDALLGGGNHAPCPGGCPFNLLCLQKWFAFVLPHAVVVDLRHGVKAFQKMNGSIFFKKAFKKNCYQPLEQELHSPCVYSKGCSTIWKVCLPFSFHMQGSPFLGGSWERKPQKFPLLSMHSAQNMLSGNTCSCLRKEGAGCSAVHSLSTKHVRLDHFASCSNATSNSPKMQEIRRLNNVG